MKKNSKFLLVSDQINYAEIIIAENPPRLVSLAAIEFQNYIQKITGKKIPIHTKTSRNYPVKVYIGESSYTQKLGLPQVENGFFIKTGKNWLALVGKDADFIPKSNTALFHQNRPKVRQEWQKKTNSQWSTPGEQLFENYNHKLGIWRMDKGGSLQAVYEFLRMQGVRWYLPSEELGEVTPSKKTIDISPIDRNYEPVFPIRKFLFYGQRYFQASREEILWQLRLGLNAGDEILGMNGTEHGIRHIMVDERMKKDHPEYFALYNKKRDTHFNKYGQPCLSIEGLKKENIAFAKAVFDIYDEPMINIMPTDAYTKLCECDLCRGKATPKRGIQGRLSDYVWSYVNNVAQELYKTHPNKKIICFAYGAYLLPPNKIDQLSPNIVVGICRNRASFVDLDTKKFFLNLQKEWETKTDNKTVLWDYYLDARPNKKKAHIPVVFPHIIDEDIKRNKNKSYGEFIEVYRRIGDESYKVDLAINHLNIYVTSYLYWHPEADIDVILDDYYQKFYGKSSSIMKEFFTYAENHWAEIENNPAKVKKLFELLEKARLTARADDKVYQKRIQMVLDYIKPLEQSVLTLNRKTSREAIRVFAQPENTLKLDGFINEKQFWHVPIYSLLNSQKGYYTTFQLVRTKEAIFLGIKCRHQKLSKNISAKRLRNIFQEDVIELTIEPQLKELYKFSFSINGVNEEHCSENVKGIKTRLQTSINYSDNSWELEAKIPISEDLALSNDAVVGRYPTKVLPWFLNLTRVTVDEEGKEVYSSLISENKNDASNTNKFAQLYFAN